MALFQVFIFRTPPKDGISSSGSKMVAKALCQATQA